MACALEYREFAEQQLNAARSAQLPLVRQRHLQAAERWQQLADRGLAPAATAEGFKAAYDQAQATLKANQARAGDRVIRAPFAGVVGLTDIAPGALINPGAPIVTLDDLSTVRVDFSVPERQPCSLPLVQWFTRVGRYQGMPQSHSMSLS